MIGSLIQNTLQFTYGHLQFDKKNFWGDMPRIPGWDREQWEEGPMTVSSPRAPK